MYHCILTKNICTSCTVCRYLEYLSPTYADQLSQLPRIQQGSTSWGCCLQQTALHGASQAAPIFFGMLKEGSFLANLWEQHNPNFRNLICLRVIILFLQNPINFCNFGDHWGVFVPCLSFRFKFTMTIIRIDHDHQVVLLVTSRLFQTFSPITNCLN